jgi:hypothetical protein
VLSLKVCLYIVLIHLPVNTLRNVCYDENDSVLVTTDAGPSLGDRLITHDRVSQTHPRYMMDKLLVSRAGRIVPNKQQSSIQAGKVDSSITRQLTRAIGVGVGDASASPTAALLLSVLQESMGRIATILFAHKLGTSLEPECKMYRLAADIFNDTAMILDCLSPAFPKPGRVLILSFSSVLRSLCGVCAGSAKASLSAHFAKRGNLGELNAVSYPKCFSGGFWLSDVHMDTGSFIYSATCGTVPISFALISFAERLQPRDGHFVVRNASKCFSKTVY